MPIPVPAPSPASPAAPVSGAVVTLGDLTIVQGQVINGVRWFVEPIVGWDDLPEGTGAATQRASSHGMWLDEQWLSGRVLQVNGLLVGRDWTAMANASRSVIAAIPVGDTAGLTVAAANEPVLTAQVRQNGKPLVDPDGHQRRFSLSLVAPDPRRYSVDVVVAATGLPQTSGGLSVPLSVPLSIPASVTSGRLTLVNDGNFATPPVFTVVGPCPPCTITHVGTGRTLRVPEAVPAGRSLTIAGGEARLDGTAYRVVTGSWFELEPGTNEVAFSAATYDPDAQLVVSFRSAWR